MRSNGWIVIAAVGAAIAACSSNSASPGGNPGDASPAEDGGGTPEAAPPAQDSGSAADGGTVSVVGQVVDASVLSAAKNFDATQYAGLQGVQVCVYGQSAVPCTTTDASGKYTLAVPPGAAFTVSYTKTGYESYLYAQSAMSAGTTAPLAAIFLTSTDTANSFATAAGATPDATKGVILFGGGTVGTPAPGAVYHEMFGPYDYYYASGYSVSVSPAVTVGPVYVGTNWMPDPTLKASSTAGWGFIQAPPGTYTLTYSAPDLNCGSTMATVVAGYTTTYVGVACTVVDDAGAPASDASPADGAAPPADAPSE
jgi:hypothetical protein